MSVTNSIFCHVFVQLLINVGCNLVNGVQYSTIIVLHILIDTFASKVSATNDRYADSSIGNVTGSNAVNVFLGIGIAWSMAAIYHASNGHKFYVAPGTLAFSVTVFCAMALMTVVILIARRRPSIGGELGGPYVQKVITSLVMVSFWVTYIAVSAMVSYCYIEGF